MQITGKDEPSMILTVDTGKHAALCAKLNIPVDTPADIVLDAMMDKLSFHEIYHRGLEWIDRQVFKLEAKKKSKV